MRITALCLILLMGLGFGGCAAKNQAAEAVRKDLSPTRESMAMSPEERLNRRAQTWDVNVRQIPDDWDAFWFDDRPMRMSIYPVP